MCQTNVEIGDGNNIGIGDDTYDIGIGDTSKLDIANKEIVSAYICLFLCFYLHLFHFGKYWCSKCSQQMDRRSE